MTIFQLLAAIVTFLLASYTAYRIGADKPIAHIHFGKPISAKNTHTDIEAELERSKLLVLQKDAQRRKKQREAVRARKRVKGKFA